MSELIREKIWDPVTRIWHWVLVIVLSLGWSFGEFMSFDNVRWHFYLGYTLLGLVCIRLCWGIIGPQPIRLRGLFASLRQLAHYIRNLPKRQPSGTAGHNPLGALSILLMLLALFLQGFTGLFIESEDFFENGPLFNLVSEETVKFMSTWHHRIAKLILALVVLHIGAIIYYLVWKKENLIRPMLTGWKWVRRR